jgi:hypothetical protein
MMRRLLLLSLPLVGCTRTNVALGAGAKVAGAILGTGTERKGKAVAIHTGDDTAKVNRVCAQR